MHWYSCLWNKYQPDINKLRGVNHKLPRPWLLEEPNKVLTLGKHVHYSSSQAFLWNSGKNVSLIFGEKKEIRSSFWFGFSLNSSQHRGYTLPPTSNLFSTSPPATHFSPINDPSPTTRLCFYMAVIEGWPAMASVTETSPHLIILWCLRLTAVSRHLFGIDHLKLFYMN